MADLSNSGLGMAPVFSRSASLSGSRISVGEPPSSKSTIFWRLTHNTSASSRVCETRKGVEIYEGDIVLGHWRRGWVGVQKKPTDFVVEWNEAQRGWTGEGQASTNAQFRTLPQFDQCEVVGHVFRRAGWKSSGGSLTLARPSCGFVPPHRARSSPRLP
jgi:hypothetical protein